MRFCGFCKGRVGRHAAFAVSPGGILCGAMVGIVTVLIAAHSPAKQAAKVSPVAAVSGNAGETKKLVRAANTRLLRWKRLLEFTMRQGEKEFILDDRFFCPYNRAVPDIFCLP